MKTWVACGASLAAGVLGMWWFTARAHAGVGLPARDAAVQHAPSSQPGLDEEQRALLEAQRMRAIVAQEVRGALREAQSAPSSSASAAPASAASLAEPEPEAPLEPTANFAPTRAFVDQRLVAGHWTEEDRNKLRHEMVSLHRQERRELIKDVFRAINAGQMQLDADEPL